jgi:hypothetical protein
MDKRSVEYRTLDDIGTGTIQLSVHIQYNILRTA